MPKKWTHAKNECYTLHQLHTISTWKCTAIIHVQRTLPLSKDVMAFRDLIQAIPSWKKESYVVLPSAGTTEQIKLLSMASRAIKR